MNTQSSIRVIILGGGKGGRALLDLLFHLPHIHTPFHGEKESEYVLGHFDIGNPHHPHPPIRSHTDLIRERFREKYRDMVFR